MRPAEFKPAALEPALLEAHGRAGYAGSMSPFQRHIAACNNARLPGERLAFRLGDVQIGWVLPPLAEALAHFPAVTWGAAGLSLARPAELPAIARALSQAGQFRWRGEAFDVRADPDGPALTQIDRGALPKFGIMASGVHLNGLVRAPDGLLLWIARRAQDKLLDPGKLDHIVAGGVPAGMTPAQTLLKEAAEEAAIPAALVANATAVGHIGYAMERAEGLRRDLLHCYDLMLPAAFVPRPVDGEVERFELWPVSRAFAAVRDGESFKFNVNLVLIDLFLRLDLIEGQEAADLRTSLHRVP